MENKKHEQEYENMGGLAIAEVLISHPRLFNKLKPFLGEMNRWAVAWVLIERPELVDKMKPYLGKLDGWTIMAVLIQHPELVDKLKSYLDKMDVAEWDWLLKFQPQLEKFRKVAAGGKMNTTNKRIENSRIGLRCGEARVMRGWGNHIRHPLRLGKRIFRWNVPNDLELLAKRRKCSFLGLGDWRAWGGFTGIRYFCLVTHNGNITYIDCDALGDLLMLL